MDPSNNHKSPTNSSPTFASRLEFFARATAYASLSTVAFLAATLLAPVTYVAGNPEKATRATRWILGEVVSPLLGIELDVEGKENLSEELNDGRRIFVANHQAALDLLIAGKLFPRRTFVMAKKELAYAPLLGWFLAMTGHYFVKRRDHATTGSEEAEAKAHEAAMLTMEGIKERMIEHNDGLFLFPEGTRSHAVTPTLLPFKRGAFILAIETEAPIVPVVIANYSDIYNTRRQIFKSGTIKVKVLGPIETKGLNTDDVDKLMRRTFEEMQRVYKEISPVKAKL